MMILYVTEVNSGFMIKKKLKMAAPVLYLLMSIKSFTKIKTIT